MGYGDPKDRALDKTVAWVTSALVTLAIVIVCWVGYSYNYAQTTERKAIESGYCQTPNVNSAGQYTGGYHWEKCPPAK